MAANGPEVLILDNGSYTIKAGVSGENGPRATIPTLVGRPRHTGILGIKLQDVYHGDDAYRKRGIMALRHPIQNGIITNFDDAASLWAYTYEAHLKLSPSVHPVLMTDSPVNEAQNRERLAQVAFESLGVPALNISNTASLALYASGYTTGLVVDFGEDATHVTPIENGRALKRQALRMDVGGRNVAELVAQFTLETLHPARDIVRGACYIALDYEKEAAAYQTAPEGSPARVQEKYVLPDGSEVQLVDAAFRAPEVLFQPSFRGYDLLPGIHQQIHTCISSTSSSLHRDLYSHILLSGSNSLFPGLPQRLTEEVQRLAGDEYRSDAVRIIASRGRELAPWIGGSILSSLDIFGDMLVNKHEWEEAGERIVHQKYVL